MKLTKYAHACFTIEQNNQVLVIDPGTFSRDFTIPTSVVGVVITHQHADHFSPSLLEKIIKKNPNAVIMAHPSLIEQMELLPAKPVLAGEHHTVGVFRLAFFGGEHALIHDSLPIIPNLGVFINDTVYYPGDSFAAPDGHAVDTLALPVAAPWLKISETLAFLRTITPRIAFPTHDGILSADGKQIVDGMIKPIAQAQDTLYRRLKEPLLLHEKNPLV